MRARYRDGQDEGEATLLVYDHDSFGDLLVSRDIKEVFENRASTANIYIAVPFLNSAACRELLKEGSTVKRAASYFAGKTGNVYLIELHVAAERAVISIGACPLAWNEATGEVLFGQTIKLAQPLQDGWLFDLFDRNDGLVVAPPGVHFRKSSSKHSTSFLRAANVLNSSAACGILSIFTLPILGCFQPRQILVDTAPLLSLSFSLTRAARAHDVWTEDVSSRSFSSYGGLEKVGRLSSNDIILISATTSGSLGSRLIASGAQSKNVVTLYFLGPKGAERPPGVLCNLGVTPERSLGYLPVTNFSATDCALCQSDHILAPLEGDQFLLQRRQHRTLKILKKTQSSEARVVLTELHQCDALSALLRTELSNGCPISIDVERLLKSPEIRADFLRLLRRYAPQPLGLVVLANISTNEFKTLVTDAGLVRAFAAASIIEWTDIGKTAPLPTGAGALVVFGHLSSHTQARSINASLRAVVNQGNVTYLSALTVAGTPEQYQDLKMFLSYGERGLDSFTYREARRLALPGRLDIANSFERELDLLDRIASKNSFPGVQARRYFLSNRTKSRTDLFLPGRQSKPLVIQRDFVYLDTRSGVERICQADVFAVILNLLCAARSADRELAVKAKAGSELLTLTQSVYGHVLVSPETFEKYNDAILKACILRAAKSSELRYDVDEHYSSQIFEIVLAEIAAWENGSGDALPEFLLALATEKLHLTEMHRLQIRKQTLKLALSPLLTAIADAIPN
uniref:hypothetical protein n=1 Tax=Variovorax sp. BK018 TaxID=3450241 RepID=UPI0040398EAE